MATNDRVISSWSDTQVAQAWKANDGLLDLLALPRALALALVAESGSPSLVVDVGSGPGTILAQALDRFPQARGVWYDASPAMQDLARETLSAHLDRVEFVVGDAADLLDCTAARGADLITNSRVAHHFDADGLRKFYRDCAELLAPDGWVVTLDHILPPGDWDRRYRAVITQFAGPNAGKPGHPHYFPFPSVQQHLDALAAAGLTDADLAWKAMYTCLYLGRRPAA